jgi:hypothetical protein
MANEFEKIGEDILHGIEEPVLFIDKAIKVIDTAVKNQPEMQADFKTLVSQVEGLSASVGVDVAERGLNPTDDLTTLQKIKTLCAFVTGTLGPDIEKVYGQIKTDLGDTSQAPPAGTATA